MERVKAAIPLPGIAVDEDYRRAGLVPPGPEDLRRFAGPLSAKADPAPTPDPMANLGMDILQKAVDLGFKLLESFLKPWLEPTTPVHGGSQPVYAHVGQVVRVGVFNPDDFATVMMNDKMVGGASIGQEVQMLADQVKPGLNLLVAKLENSGGGPWGIDMYACRDGQAAWESQVNVEGNEGIFRTTHLVVFQIYGQ